MKNYGNAGTYVAAQSHIDLTRPTKRRRGHVAVQPRCPKCRLRLSGRGDHLCLDLTQPEPVVEKAEKGPRKMSPRSAEHTANLGAAQRERWARENASRSAAIVERYSQGDLGIVGLAREFRTSRKTISTALHYAAAQGLVEIRKPGHTIAKGA